MKERITITIDERMLKLLDEQVDGVTVKNRSHAIELNLAKALQRKSITQAVIFAGGKYDVTQDRQEIPTVLAKIKGKSILEHNINMLKRQGVTDIILSISHRKEAIQNYFGNGEAFGVHITYVEDENPQGTAGVLRNVAPLITGTFIACNGDELKTIDIKDMLAFHRKQGTMATLAVTTTSNPKEYGVVVLNGNHVYSFIEKPTGKIPTNLINAGLYIFEPEVISMVPQGFGRLEQDVFPKLAQKEELSGYVFYGAWQDVKTTAGLEEATAYWEQQQLF